MGRTAADRDGGQRLLLRSLAPFLRMNRSAEKIEPEAMRDAKKEDEKLKS